MAGASGDFVEITSVERHLFRQWPAEELYRMYDVLLAGHRKMSDGRMTKIAYERLVQAIGFNANEHGILADQRLRSHMSLLDVMCWDWVHVALSDGFLTGEASLIVASAHPYGVDWATLENWLQWDGWRFPKHCKAKGEDLHRIFSNHRSTTDPLKIKVSCSELLGLYGLLRHFVELHIPSVDGLRPALASFVAACTVVDVLLDAKRLNTNVLDVADRLDTLTVEYLRLHKVAYGTQAVRPKHHWMLDISGQLRRSQCVFDAFIIERNHLVVKAIAEQVDRTTVFERSVLTGLLNKMHSLEVSHEGLVGKRAKLPGSHNVLVADSMRRFGLDLAVGDVIRCCNAFGIVRACVSELEVSVAIVALLEVVARPVGHYVKCKLTRDRTLEMWSPADIHQCKAWYVDSDSHLVVVL
jgi:hypothetical protein